MERYKNLSGNSGVVAYEIVEDGIKVQFKNGFLYHYTNESVGPANIEKMHRLAIAGRGLATFINENPAVKHGYISKFP